MQDARLRIAPLDRVPYLLCRLEEEGVAARCVEQWEELPEDAHHRVTAEFLKPGNQLRKDIDDIGAHGVSAMLKAECASIAMIPLDDTVAEAPHATAKQLLDHAKATRWPFLAATMNLDANLQVVQELPAVVDCDVPDLWRRYKSVLQTNPHHLGRPKRMKKKRFADRLYRLNHFLDEADRDEPPADVLPGDDPGGGDAAGGDASDGDSDDAGDDDDPGDDSKPAVRLSFRERVRMRCPHVARGRVAVDVSLMRQWLAAGLQALQFLSLPARGEDGNRFALFLQVLSVETNPILLDVASPDTLHEVGHYRISAQILERWAPPVDESVVRPEEFVFVFSGPQRVDLLQIMGTDPTIRSEIKTWQCKASDVEGCMCLHTPATLQVSTSLSSARIPVFCLLDELAAQGWTGVDRLVAHSPDSPLEFDIRRCHQKRWYYQVLLALKTLWSCGIEPFNSGQSSGFYELLLVSKKTVDRRLKAKVIRRMVQECKGTAGALVSLDRAPAPPKPVAAAVVPELPDMDIEGDDGGPGPVADIEGDIAGDLDIEGDEILERPPADPIDIAGVDEVPADFVPARIEGQPVRFVRGRNAGGWRYHDRMSITCPHHAGCSRSRSLELDKDVFGPRAAALFLGCWARGGAGVSPGDHPKTPSRAAVQEYADSLGDGAWD